MRTRRATSNPGCVLSRQVDVSRRVPTKVLGQKPCSESNDSREYIARARICMPKEINNFPLCFKKGRSHYAQWTRAVSAGHSVVVVYCQSHRVNLKISFVLGNLSNGPTATSRNRERRPTRERN